MSTGTSGPVIIGVTMMTEVLAAIAIGLRVWSQQIKKRSFFAHDVFIISGFVVVAIQLFWCFAMTSVRFSILHLYIHLFSSHHRFRIGCYVLLGFCASWAVGETLTVFLLCRPLSNWNQLVVGGTCGDINGAYLSIHTTNFFLDTSIALIPSTVLWGLKMPTRRKVGIAIMFALGALICIISIARVALYQLALGLGGSDFSWTGSTLFLFTAIEAHLGCVLACMPLIRPAGEKLASMSFVSWARSLINRSTASKSTNEGPASAEALHCGPAGDWQKMPSDRLNDNGEGGIRCTVHLEQHSFQGRNVSQPQSWN
ncbi:hypothetical protein PG991_014648 [Apiospora marii]|uniref:Rhodopsin domain-containing protein n=1 Tax=Apiospora marii TaxID=335849 RepID=A0ABR1R4A2_9PEZI